MPRLALLLLLLIVLPARAQVLNAPWVRDADERIDKLRKSGLRVIVLDEKGRPVPGATVTVTLEQPAFDFGRRYVLPELSRKPFEKISQINRCLSGSALDNETGGSHLHKYVASQIGIERFLDSIDDAGRVKRDRWGVILPADAAMLPRFLQEEIESGQTPMAVILLRHTRTILTRAGSIDQFDLICDRLAPDGLDDQLGVAVIRDLFEQARVAAPHARLAIRFDDALTGERQALMLARVAELRDAFVPVERISLEARFRGQVLERALTRSLDAAGSSGMRIDLVDVEVGGSSPEEAAINLETLLRVAFAHPSVEGVWFKGLYADELGDPNAALLDESGLTPVGRVLVGLIGDRWFAPHKGVSDEIGNVHARVLGGIHRFKASYPDGTVVETVARIVPQLAERVVILQPSPRPSATRPAATLPATQP